MKNKHLITSNTIYQICFCLFYLFHRFEGLLTPHWKTVKWLSIEGAQRVPVVFNQSEFILGPPPPRSGPDRQIGILRVDIELDEIGIKITTFNS